MKLFQLTLFLFAITCFSQNVTIKSLDFRGAKKTKKATLFKIISSKENESLDSLKLNNDIILLKRLPAVSHAYYQVINENEVLITIEENFTLIPNLSFWSTTNRDFAYKIGLYDYNFLGRNITFGGFYQNNGFNSYGINFRAPTLFSRKLGLAINHQSWASEEPLYFDGGSANYKYQNISYEVLGLYQFNLQHSIELGINFFNEKYNYLSGFTPPVEAQQLDVNKKLLKFIYNYDNLDYYYQYVSGFKSQFYGQYVTSSNKYQEDFLIFWNDFFYYKRVGDKGNWANRLRVGLSSNNESPFAPFALDNNVNLRGVGILVDRGTGSVVWNTEYRHTLLERKWFTLQSNVFTDFGTWRNPGGGLDDFIDGDNVRVYSGVGLRFINKKVFNAVFRIDYGYGLTKNASKGFVFGIGQYF